MLHILLERLRQKYRTVGYPATLPVLSPRFRGRPFINPEILWNDDAFTTCFAQCPSGALLADGLHPSIDMGRCHFCGNCSKYGPKNGIAFTGQWQLAASRREDLVIKAGQTEAPPVTAKKDIQQILRKSYRLRQVSAGGCNACEADLNVLTTIVFDIGRFGIDFVASPRHADALAITGPVARNMQKALLKCEAAMPKPRMVMAFGACAISGGIFSDHTTVLPGSDLAFRQLSDTSKKSWCPQTEHPLSSQRAHGVSPHLSVDLFVPGCPPHPYTSLDGMLRLLGIIT